jgi:hypothetical protein
MAIYAIDSGKVQVIEDLLSCALMSLVSENQRPSIRYLGEWILILVAKSCPELAIPQGPMI